METEQTEKKPVDKFMDAIGEMFTEGTGNLEDTAAKLAEEITIEDDALAKLDSELVTRKEKNRAAKTQLAELLMTAGLTSIKLESGLSPKVKITRKFYKQSGIGDEDLFEWLRVNGLDGIIKPTVHFSTLQATLREFEQQGNILPEETFNMIDEKTVTMYGKSKFLAQQNST